MRRKFAVKLLSGGRFTPCVDAAPRAEHFPEALLELRADADQQHRRRVAHVVRPVVEIRRGSDPVPASRACVEVSSVMSKFAAWSVVSWTLRLFRSRPRNRRRAAAASTGRRVPLGGAAPAMAFAASGDRLARAFDRHDPRLDPRERLWILVDRADADQLAVRVEDRPARRLAPMRRSAKIACDVTRVTSPSMTSLPDNIDAAIVVSSS